MKVKGEGCAKAGHKLSGSAEVGGEGGVSWVKVIWDADPGVVLRRPAMTLLVIFGGLTDRIGLGWEALLKRKKTETKSHYNAELTCRI